MTIEKFIINLISFRIVLKPTFYFISLPSENDEDRVTSPCTVEIISSLNIQVIP